MRDSDVAKENAKCVRIIREACCLPGLTTTTILPVLLSLLQGQSEDVVWETFPIFHQFCEKTWPYRSAVLRLLRAQQSRPLVRSDLSWPIKIYRACSREHVRGVSWTTDREAAEFLARENFDLVEDLVIATAFVEQGAVFSISNWDKCEVLVEPRRLRKLHVESFDLLSVAGEVGSDAGRVLH